MKYTEEDEVIEQLKKQSKFFIENNIENTDSEKILNVIEKQQKEIKALQKIITKDLPTDKEYINTFCGISIVEAMDMIEICKNKTIHLNDKEYKKVIELSQKDYLPKEVIREKIKELESTKFGSCVNPIVILKELLGDE